MVHFLKVVETFLNFYGVLLNLDAKAEYIKSTSYNFNNQDSFSRTIKGYMIPTFFKAGLSLASSYYFHYKTSA